MTSAVMAHRNVAPAILGKVALAATLALVLSSAALATGIFKCVGEDGNTIYADTPCGPDAHQQQPAAAIPKPTTSASTPLTPEVIAAAQDKSARESAAIACSTERYNAWIRAQGHPLPDRNTRIAKLIEISNQCRRPLNLPDMLELKPVPEPKPILSGPAGDAAATKLRELVKTGSIERLQQYLASPGVDINDRPGSDEAMLDYAAEQNQTAVARFLIEHGARVDAVQTQGQNRGFTALHRAAIANAAEVASLLLAGGAEVNVHGPLGVTPLILAASHGSRRTAEVLLDHGADISVATGHRETALSEATAHGYKDIVQLLLTRLPTPTMSNMDAMASRGDLEALRLILMHDELVHDVSARMKDEALRFAVMGKDRLDERRQMIELLLAHGADVNNRLNNAPNIPIMMASTPELLEVLIAHGADLNWNGMVAPSIACNPSATDAVAMLKALAAHGVDVTASPKTGSSAMQCAVALHRTDLEAYLRTRGTPEAAAAIQSAPFKQLPADPSGWKATGHCVELSATENRRAPPDLYADVLQCIEQNRDADGIALFVLAGMDSNFDALRVTDQTAAQARQILLMYLFSSVSPQAHDRFNHAMQEAMTDSKRLAVLCERLRAVGPPQYFPSYMVNHGLGVMNSALAGKPSPPPLKTDFDSAATWASVESHYVDCPRRLSER